MRIAITSDIHFFPQWANKLQELAELLQLERPDLFILAGDIGEPLYMFTRGLENFTGVCERRAAVAGNHDVWHRTFTYTSDHLWKSLLPEAASAYNYTWLEHENLIIDDLGICGTIAWYDYGGKHPHLQLDDEFYQSIKPQISNDANYIDWSWTDIEFAQKVGEDFEKRLDALDTNPEVNDIIIVTHVPLFKGCLKPINTVEQGILNAYYANVELGQKVLERNKVRAVFSGHVHHERQLRIARPIDTTALSAYTIPSDYGSPAAIILNTSTWETEVIRVPGD